MRDRTELQNEREAMGKTIFPGQFRKGAYRRLLLQYGHDDSICRDMEMSIRKETICEMFLPLLGTTQDRAQSGRLSMDGKRKD